MPYTTHGHWYGPGEPTEPRPRGVARCGGPGICGQCAREAGRAAPDRTPPDDTTEGLGSPRHTPTVPNPCGITRDVLFVGDGVHVCEQIPDHARAADDREHICCCGFVWNDSEAPATTAPVTAEGASALKESLTAEGLRERIAAAVRGELVGLHNDVPASLDVADAVLAALAGDPGDLPARMADAIRSHDIAEGTDDDWDGDGTRCVCGEQVTDWEAHAAAAAMSVRWEHAAHLTARLAQAEARAEFAEGQLSALRDHRARWETEKARADKAEAERDVLGEHILDIDAHATPYGDIPDEPGYVGTYLLTAGALHRALGKIGHSAPNCQAEAVVAGAKALAEQWIGNQDAGTIGDSIRADAGRQLLAHLRALDGADSPGDAERIADEKPTGVHAFEQNPAATQISVCICGLWRDHHVHGADPCGCDACRTPETAPDAPTEDYA